MRCSEAPRRRRLVQMCTPKMTEVGEVFLVKNGLTVSHHSSNPYTIRRDGCPRTPSFQRQRTARRCVELKAKHDQGCFTPLWTPSKATSLLCSSRLDSVSHTPDDRTGASSRVRHTKALWCTLPHCRFLCSNHRCGCFCRGWLSPALVF